MNKTILILAIFAICLAPTAFSAEMKENENRELAGVKLGNLKDIIGGIVGAIKNQTNNNNNTNTNTTTPSIPATNNTNTTTPTTPPVTNSTNSTTPTNPTTPPVTNTTDPDSDDSDVGSSNPDVPTTNSTSPTNSTNTTTPSNNTNTTTPAAPAPVKYAKNDVNMKTFPEDCLAVHNQVRKDVGLGNLVWSESLAASAQTWAENMAKNGFRHSGKTGENIASSTYSTKTLSRLLGLWTKEKNYYIVGCKYPSCSSTSAEVGHYTQMVWHSTTQVGCGFAPGYNRGYNYLCCQYYKAGNIRGQYVYPVPTA